MWTEERKSRYVFWQRLKKLLETPMLLAPVLTEDTSLGLPITLDGWRWSVVELENVLHHRISFDMGNPILFPYPGVYLYISETVARRVIEEAERLAVSQTAVSISFRSLLRRVP